jgi:hypothetical protein
VDTMDGAAKRAAELAASPGIIAGPAATMGA